MWRPKFTGYFVCEIGSSMNTVPGIDVLTKDGGVLRRSPPLAMSLRSRPCCGLFIDAHSRKTRNASKPGPGTEEPRRG